MIAAILPGPDGDAAVEAARALVARWPRADFLLELRLDLQTTPDPAVAGRLPLPVIATCRRPAEGGAFEGDEELRLHLLGEAAAAGATFIDLELGVAPPAALPWDVRRIISLHDCEGLPGDLQALVREGFRSGADVVKLAVTPRDMQDVLELRRAAAVEPGAVVAVGMGPCGLVTRQLYEQMGSPWTYAASCEEARRQLGTDVPTVAELDAFRRGATSIDTPPRRVLGVLSDRAGDSIGPRVFNSLFARWGVDAGYLALSSADLGGLEAFLDAFEFYGLSVTTPFKEALPREADVLREPVPAVGAANTLLRGHEGLEAGNTDVAGVSEPLHKAGVATRDARALVVGCGGAGRAAAFALKELGCYVAITGRSADRALRAARDLDVEHQERATGSHEILINATPAGGRRDPRGLAVPEDVVRAAGLVLEMNYGLAPTPFERIAAEGGARVIRGSAMYAAQAWAQLKLFLGDGRGPAADLDRAVEEALS